MTHRHRRSTRPATVVAVCASALAVLAVLTVPHLFSTPGHGPPGIPQPPTPTQAPDAPGTRTWQPVKCSEDPSDGCAVPDTIDHAGVLMYSVRGSRLVWHDEDAEPVLRVELPRSKGERWVLVGARFAGGGSRLRVTVGDSTPATVPTDPLSLFALRGHGAISITIADDGKPRDGEILRIEAYVQR